MHRSNLSNINIINEEVLITPEELKVKLPLSEKARAFIQKSRQEIADIIHKKDHRMLVVCGPCSIHDIKAAKEYAKRLKALSEELSDQLYIVMRVYFEKPRTTVGWKGLINDPKLDGTFDIEHGLHVGRQLLTELAEMKFLWRQKHWILSVRSTLLILSAGQRLVPVLLNLRHTGKWPAAFLCLSGLKMVRTAACLRRSMPCRPLLQGTVLWGSATMVR